MRPDCAACCFIAGTWSQLDAILGLPKSRDCGNLNFPNYVKPVAAYFHKKENVAKLQNIAIDDFSVNPISHIAEKLEGSLVRPGTRKGQVAHIARERTGCLFHV